MGQEDNIIEKLTPEQEAKLPEYKKRWMKIGMSTEPVDKQATEKFIAEIYKENGYSAPPFKWFSSPFKVLDYFKEHYPDELNNVMKSWIYGNHEAHWLSFYEFFLRECKLECCKKIEKFIECAKVSGWWLPFDECCFCVERPTRLFQDENGNLHNENGPAIEYSDGAGVYYFINGINVPSEIVLTPAEKLDPMLVVKETNVDIRRIIIDKIGIKRIEQKLGSTIIDKGVDDNGKPAWLVNIDLKDGKIRPYFKFEYASLPGMFGLESIPPNIKTVEKAKRWRNDSNEIPKILT